MTDLACELDTLKLCRAVEKAFFDAGFVPGVKLAPPPPPPQPPQPPLQPGLQDRPFSLGSLVVLETDPTTPVTIRVVVGRRRDGRVVSTLVQPPPWQAPAFRTDPESHLRRIDGVDEHRFRSACAACPIRHGCERSEGDAPIPLDTCFLQRCVRPPMETDK